MKTLLFVCSLTAGLLFRGPAAAETTYLDATFDDKPIDQPIGVGGASVGEPVSLYEGLVTAIVRSGPTPTPCLEIQDVTDFGAGAVRFEFLGSQEITSGFLSIALDLWFHELGEGHRFILYIREQGSSACNIASLAFTEGGYVILDDDTHSGAVIGAYVTGKVFPVVLNFYMEGGTYDVWLDGVQVVTQQAHGVTECGIGAISVGCDHDTDLLGKISVDRIRVTDFHQEVGAFPASWGQIRFLYR